MASWWLNVFFLVNGVWLPGAYFDGWAPLPYQSQAACMARKEAGEGNCARVPLRFEAAWICSPDRPLAEAPPELDPGASLPGRILWSLRARYYAWRVASDSLADIEIFVLYHDPEHTYAVPHSLGLQKGLFGIVHAYADRRSDATNAVVVAHEVMHTFGASDKYDLKSTLPIFPQGYADPVAEPRYPQAAAEIMGGRIALAPDEAVMPASLADVVVGPETAAEVNWTGR